jgi:predicted Zn finger-like uncharacterized protein
MSDKMEKINQSCPNCQARYVYFHEQIGPDGSVECQNCGSLMRISEESLQALPIEVVIARPIFSRRFLYGFAITMLLMFIIFLLMHNTLDFDFIYPPGVYPIP